MTAWARLESGAVRKVPLDRFCSEASIASLGEGALAAEIRGESGSDEAAAGRRPRS